MSKTIRMKLSKKGIWAIMVQSWRSDIIKLFC